MRDDKRAAMKIYFLWLLAAARAQYAPTLAPTIEDPDRLVDRHVSIGCDPTATRHAREL